MNILCFGDSNTYGYRPDGTGRFDEKQDGPACFRRNSATDIALSKKDCAAAQLFFRTLFAKAAAD